MSKRVWRAITGFGRDREVLGSVLALSVKLAGSLLMFGLFALTASLVSKAEFGLLASVYNAAALIAVLAVFGQDIGIVRWWGEATARERPDMLKGALIAGAAGAATGGAAFALLFFLLAPTFLQFDATTGLLVTALFIAAQALLHFSSHASRVVHGIMISELVRELASRSLILAAVLMAWFGVWSLDTTRFMTAALASTVMAVAMQAFAIWRRLPLQVIEAPREFNPSRWAQQSVSVWIPAAAEATNHYADVILIGLMFGPETAAGYFACQRIANALAMLSTGLYAYASSKISVLYFKNSRQDIERLMAKIMLVVAPVAIAITATAVIFAEDLLGLFGSSYVVEANSLRLLIAATLSVTLSGPCGGMLMLTGNELVYTKLLIASIVARSVLILLLVPQFGTFGAALAATLTAVPLAVGLSIFAYRQLDIDFSILGVVRQR